MTVGSRESRRRNNTQKINKLSADLANTKNRSPKIALADDENLFSLFSHFPLSQRITQMSPSRKKTVPFIPFAFIFAARFLVCTNYLQAINQDLGFLIKSFNSLFFSRTAYTLCKFTLPFLFDAFLFSVSGFYCRTFFGV